MATARSIRCSSAPFATDTCRSDVAASPVSDTGHLRDDVVHHVVGVEVGVEDQVGAVPRLDDQRGGPVGQRLARAGRVGDRVAQLRPALLEPERGAVGGDRAVDRGGRLGRPPARAPAAPAAASASPAAARTAVVRSAASRPSSVPAGATTRTPTRSLALNAICPSWLRRYARVVNASAARNTRAISANFCAKRRRPRRAAAGPRKRDTVGEIGRAAQKLERRSCARTYRSRVMAAIRPHGHFLAAEVGELAGVSGTTIGQWARRGYIRSSASDGEPRVYSVEDVAEAAIVGELLDRGVAHADIRRAIDRLRRGVRRVAAQRRAARHGVRARPRARGPARARRLLPARPARLAADDRAAGDRRGAAPPQPLTSGSGRAPRAARRRRWPRGRG